MATIQSIKTKIQGLIDKSNEATGGTDTDLTTAVNNLIANQGGSDPTDGWERDINFYDYDGTLLYSYSLAEFQQLTELPPLPSHDGLICQEWNWTLEDIKAEEHELDVGATYITDDGKTRLYISITSGTLTLRIYQSVTNGVTIDWGDGSSTETISGTGNVSTTHTYSANGDFVITLLPTDECILSFGGGTATTSIFYENTGYVRAGLKKLEVGKNVTNISAHAFLNSNALEKITLPNGCTLNTACFQNARSVTFVVIPKGATLGDSIFMNAYSLKGISICNGITTMPYKCLQNVNIERITLPNSVTEIGSYCFYSSYALKNVYGGKLKTIKSNGMGYCYKLCKIDLSNVETIEEGGFYYAYSLKEIVNLNKVKTIGSNCFQYTQIEEITFPSTLTAMPQNLLGYSLSLKKVRFLGSITSGAYQSLGYCYRLQEIDFTACTSIPTIVEKTFYDLPTGCIIKVPSSLYDSWITATYWSNFASQIVAV